MRRSVAWFVVAAPLLFACAGGARDAAARDEALLGQVPMRDKQPLFTAEHDISVARANLAAADRARDDAAVFTRTAEGELKVADARIDVSKSALQLALQHGDRDRVEQGRRDLAVAQQSRETAKAQLEYARRLSDLRDGEQTVARRALDAAKADRDLVRARLLARSGIRPAERIDQLVQRRNDAHDDLADADAAVAAKRQDVAQAEAGWRKARRRFSVASRGFPTLPPVVQPPAAPQRPAKPIPGQGTPFGPGEHPTIETPPPLPSPPVDHDRTM